MGALTADKNGVDFLEQFEFCQPCTPDPEPPFCQPINSETDIEKQPALDFSKPLQPKRSASGCGNKLCTADHSFLRKDSSLKQVASKNDTCFEPKVSDFTITLTNPYQQRRTLLSRLCSLCKKRITPSVDSRNAAGLTKAEVVAQVDAALSKTKVRLDRNIKRNTVNDSAVKRSFQADKIKRLTLRYNALKNLKQSFETSDRWRRFGGFTGWDELANDQAWSPTKCDYAQFNGWLEQVNESQQFREIMLDGSLSTTSIIHNVPEKKTALEKLEEFFKGTDGWDELGSAVGQTLPGIGQHIATFCILSVFTPAVWLGVKGMASELDEAKEKLASIMKAEISSEDKLRALFDWSNELIADDSSDSRYEQLSQQLSNKTGADFEQSALELAKYIRIKTDKKALKLADEATPWGLAAMTGMLGGITAGTFTAGLEIAAASNTPLNGLEAIESLAGAFEIVTAGLFIPAQLAMIVYAGKKVSEGKAINEGLNKNIDDLKQAFPQPLDEPPIEADAENRIDPKLTAAAEDNLHRLKKYNTRSKIVYGRGFQVCEGGMVVGGILGLAGQALASLAIMVPSALGTLFFAGFRIQQEWARGCYVGKPSGHIHDGNIAKAWNDVRRRVLNSANYRDMKQDNEVLGAASQANTKTTHACDTGCDHSHDTVGGCDHRTYDSMSDVEHTPTSYFNAVHHDATARLADSKIQSLLLHNIRQNNNNSTKFLQQIKTGRKSWGQGSSLQRDVIQCMQEKKVAAHSLFNTIKGHADKLGQYVTLAKQVFSVTDSDNEYATRQAIIRKICQQSRFHEIDADIRKKFKNQYSVASLFKQPALDHPVVEYFYDLVLSKDIGHRKTDLKAQRQSNFQSLYLHAQAINLTANRGDWIQTAAAT